MTETLKGNVPFQSLPKFANEKEALYSRSKIKRAPRRGLLSGAVHFESRICGSEDKLQVVKFGSGASRLNVRLAA